MKSISRFILILFCVIGLVSGCERDNRDQRKAQRITCENNLKVIGLAIRIWAGDHGDKYPFQVSTNAGGTLELCDRYADGFDRNALAHFLVMSNELSIPLLLCCPHDSSKTPVLNWRKLSVTNCSYRLRTDAKVSDDNPREILVVCPVDGAVLYCDGTVSRPDGKLEPTGVSASYELMQREFEKEPSNKIVSFMVMSNDLKTPQVIYKPDGKQ